MSSESPPYTNATASSTVGKQAGPAGKRKRSRLGCGTCKTRRKKCDENFTNGSCDRCRLGNFECSMETLRPSRSSAAIRNAFADKVKATPSIKQRGKQAALQDLAPKKVPPPPAPEPLSEPMGQQPSASTSGSASSPSIFLPALPSSSHSETYQQRCHQQASCYPHQPGSPSQPFSRRHSSYHDPNPNDLSISLPHPLPTSPSNSVSSLPSPYLKPSIRPSWYPQADDDDFHDSPPLEIAPEIALIDMPNYGQIQPRAPDPAGQWDNDGRLAVGLSDVLEIRAFSEQWRGFYESLNDSYFHSIPTIPRARVKHLMDLFLVGNDSSRAGMSTWCASHYGWVLSKSNDPSSQFWMNKASRFYQEGLRSLQDPRYSMYVRLGTILDLRIAQVQHWGGALAYVLLLLGEQLITEQIGPAPIINLSLLDSVSVINLRSFIWLEVIASVCIYNRPVPYQLVVSGPCSFPLPREEEAGLDARSLSVHLSLPVELLICLAEISNLSCLEGKPGCDERKRQAKSKEVEEVVLAFQASVVSSEDPAVDLAVQEMWRHATLIYLYQTIHYHLPLSSKLTTSLHAILTHSGVLPRIATCSEPKVQTALFGASTALPLFLAGTIATSREDREICRTALKEVGYGPTYEGNLAVVERVWEVTAETGRTPCWRKLVQDEGLVVAFL